MVISTASNLAILDIVHAFLTVLLGGLSGIALCLLLWAMPIIRLAPNTATKIKQFNRMILQGSRYLLPLSRTLPVFLMSLIYFSYNSSDTDIQTRWQHYIAVIMCLASIEPWEITLIFPVNDNIALMGEELARTKATDFGDIRDQDLGNMLRRWSNRHVWRVVMPLIATGIMAGSGMGLLPF